MENKKQNKTTVVLFGICAVIWAVRVIIELVSGTYSDSLVLFCMNVLCTILWIICFFVNLKRYRSGKDGQDGN